LRRDELDLTPRRAFFHAPLDDSEDEDLEDAPQGNTFSVTRGATSGRDSDDGMDAGLLDRDLEEDIVTSDEVEEVYPPQRPRLAEQLGLEPERVQRMRASFFGSSSKDSKVAREEPVRFSSWLPPPQARLPQAVAAPVPQNRPDISDHDANHAFDMWRIRELEEQAKEFKERRVFHHDVHERLNNAESCLKGRENLITDPALMHGRSFRVGWGPGGQLLHFGRAVNPVSSLRAVLKSTVVIEKVDFLSLVPAADQGALERTKDLQKRHIEDSLALAFKNSVLP